MKFGAIYCLVLHPGLRCASSGLRHLNFFGGLHQLLAQGGFSHLAWPRQRNCLGSQIAQHQFVEIAFHIASTRQFQKSRDSMEIRLHKVAKLQVSRFKAKRAEWRISVD